jgi:hypothetical protein
LFGMSLDALLEQALSGVYRLCAYVLMNGVDDPALLAFIFC